jgi:hypothetical protein
MKKISLLIFSLSVLSGIFSGKCYAQSLGRLGAADITKDPVAAILLCSGVREQTLTTHTSTACRLPPTQLKPFLLAPQPWEMIQQ